MYRHLIVTIEGKVATIQIHRPEVRNALNIDTLQELEAAFTALEGDARVAVAVLTGEGKAFVAGADIAQMKAMTAMQAREFATLGHRLLNRMERSRLPIIAAVNGYALGGGCEILMACDIILAAATAKIGQPEINLGIHPGFGGTQRLPRLVGSAKAKELLLTGDALSAEDACRIGLVNAVVAPEALAAETKALAEKLAGKSAVQLALIKAAVNTGRDISLEAANALEIASFAASFSTHDQKEGMAAFLEKRPPHFTGD